MAPVRMSVPAPSLTSPPEPPIAPAWVSVPKPMSKVPLPVRVVVREIVKVPDARSVPAPRARLPPAAPRLASDEIEIVPPLIVVPPE